MQDKPNLLYSKLDRMIMDSMKAHDDIRTRTLRLIKSAMTEEGIAQQIQALTPVLEVRVLMRMIKQRDTAYEQYMRFNRTDLADGELREKQIIEGLLPPPATEEDIRAKLQELISTGMDNHKANMGNCIRAIQEALPRANGSIVAAIVKQNLV